MKQTLIAKTSKPIRNKKKVPEYLKKLETGEKEYKFDTHKGFFFTKGRLSKKNSKFYTKEVFLGKEIKLDFKIVESNKSGIEIMLEKPFKKIGIKCKFFLKKREINLNVFSEPKNKKQEFFLKLILPLLKPIVKKQIKKEITFIKEEIESL